MSFKLLTKSRISKARLGTLKTMHGVIHTPFFMPIATKGAVKGLEASDVAALGAEIILSNTYHLYLQPGLQIIKKFGGLHDFMHTKLPVLTDSGGFQVFSLSKLRKLDDDGVTFQSHIDGSKHRLTPEKSIQIQSTLGSDIMMAFDYFPGYPASLKDTKQSVALTTAWAKRCIVWKKKNSGSKKQMLFGIVQGSTHRSLRERSARELTAMPFDGFAIGGLAVGEPAAEMYKVLDYTVPLLPENKPRYLMGVGYPEQIVEAVKRGIDMFDCVIPTREGRHGRLFVWNQRHSGATLKRDDRISLGRREQLRRDSIASCLPAGRALQNDSFYTTLNIANAKFRADTRPLDSSCDCPLCTNYSRAYLYQLFKTQDFLGQRLATIHNLQFYLTLMSRMREMIKKGEI